MVYVVGGRFEHETCTFVTLALAVPLPLVTEQLWPVGWVDTVTL
jgi:hypothetical protein